MVVAVLGHHRLLRLGLVALGGAAAWLALSAWLAPRAEAYDWTRTLNAGDSGVDVRELQIRVAGWVNTTDKTYRTMQLDGSFGGVTDRAVRDFQASYGLVVDGIVGANTQAKLNALESGDGSTVNFNFSEFDGADCACFTDGNVSSAKVRENVRRLMYRMEALRRKQGSNPIVVNSGFRTRARNTAVGGASNSQHLYGTAADNQLLNRTNRSSRDVARATAFAAIFCYDTSRHNHFDIRSNNPDDGISDTTTQDPRRFSGDSRDRDLNGNLCYGESGARDGVEDIVTDDLGIFVDRDFDTELLP